MAGFQRDQHVGVVGADGAAGVVAQIDGGIRDADVVENAAEFVRRDNFVDDAVDLAGEAFGFLDARAGGRAQVQQELPGIHAREKVPAERFREQPRADAKREEENDEGPAVFKAACQQGAIAAAKTVKALFKKILEADEWQNPEWNF